MIQFFDESNLFDQNGVFLSAAANPLPPGIQVAFYGGAVVSADTYSGTTSYIGFGGIAPVSLQANTVYTAVFVGDQAPQVYGRFQTDADGNAATVGLAPGTAGAPCSVVGYRSPSLSSLGYAIEQTKLWVNGFIDAAGSSPGGNTYPVAAGFGNVLAALDTIGQSLLAMMRIQTCTGAAFALNATYDGAGSYDTGIGAYDAQYLSDAIDSWAFDLFGDLWERQAGMSDAQWIALIQTILQTPSTTLVGIQQMLTAWSPWFSGAVSSGASPALGFDTFGGTDVEIPAPYGATPTFTDTAPGALGLVGRNIIVFDCQIAAIPNANPMLAPTLESSATLNGYLGTPLVPGQLAAYFQNPTAPDSGLAPVSISNILLNSIVSNWKAGGVNYISSGIVHPCLFLEN